MKDNCIASLSFGNGDWLGFLKALQPDAKMANHKDLAYFIGGPRITISSGEFPDAKRDLKLIERYVYPGSYWKE